MEDADSHWIDVRDKPAFLHRLMITLAGRAKISLEGDLSACQFANEMVIACDNHNVLKRQTLVPQQGFIVLRLEQITISAIFQQAMLAGTTRGLLHVQIEKGGIIQLGAYDQFHRETVVTGPLVPGSMLLALQTSGIVRSFEVAPKSGSQIN